VGYKNSQHNQSVTCKMWCEIGKKLNTWN